MDQIITNCIIYLPQLLLTVFFLSEILKPKKSKMQIYIISIILNLITIVIYYVTRQTELDSALRSLNLLAIIALCFFGTFKQKSLAFATFMLISVASDFSARAFGCFIYNIHYTDMINITPLLYRCIMICTDFFALFTILSCILYQKFFTNINTRKQLWIMFQFMFVHSVFLIFYNFINSNQINDNNNVVLFVFQLLIIIMIIINYYITLRNYRLLKVEEENKNMQREIELTYKYYESAYDKFLEISKIKHDIMNQLSVYSNMIHNNQFDDATQLNKDIQQKLFSINSVQYCDEPVINSLLTIKIDQASQQNIEFDIVLKDMQETYINKYDLCSLFANLVDNAIESCKRVNDKSNRFIRIRSSFKRDYFVISIENSSDDKIIKNGDEFISSKIHGGHGYGTKIIKSISDKYNGIFNIDQEFDVVKTTVLLKTSVNIEHSSK